MTWFFHLIISGPLYNGLILLMKILPFFDAGVIVVVFTIIIKLILLPLSIKASKSLLETKSHEKALKEIQEKHKDNKEELGKKQLEYYKEKGINPFAGILISIIQLPIIIGLYKVFINSGLPNINSAMLYSFITAPASVNMVFLGLINISQKSIVLAVLVGITTYFQVSLASKPHQTDNLETKKPEKKNGQLDMATMMATSMKYFLPVLLTSVSYSISASVALYLLTSNLFAIGQEIYIRKKYHKTVTVV